MEYPTGTLPPRSTITKSLPPKPIEPHPLPIHYQTQTCQILSLCSLQPRQIHLHFFHEQLSLHFMAWPVGEPHLQTSSSVSIHREGTPLPGSKEYLFYPITSRSLRRHPPQIRTVLPNHPRRNHRQQLQNLQIILGPDRPLPYTLFLQKPIYLFPLLLRHQLYPRPSSQ